MTPLALLPKVRSASLREAVRHMPCTLRIATFVGEPCSGRDTIVGCHIPEVFGKGTSTKVTDLAIVAGCHLCHEILDNRDPRGITIRERYPYAFQLQITRALVETQARWVEAGLIPIADMETL